MSYWDISFPDLSQVESHYFDLSKRKDCKKLLDACNAKEVGKTSDGFYVISNDGYITTHKNKDMFLFIIDWKNKTKVYKKCFLILCK